MTVKITLEYQNIEEAIVALGKISALGKVRRAANKDAGAPDASVTSAAPTPAPVAPVAPAAPADPKPARKPRADKGVQRGPYKKDDAAPEVPQAATVAGAADAAPSGALSVDAAPAAKPAAASSPVPVEKVQAALDAVLKAKGLPAALKVLGAFGVSRGRDVPEAKRAELLAACEAAVK